MAEGNGEISIEEVPGKDSEVGRTPDYRKLIDYGLDPKVSYNIVFIANIHIVGNNKVIYTIRKPSECKKKGKQYFCIIVRPNLISFTLKNSVH